ncbi:MAG: Crp/Fnr family transcriptional regulator [Clostridiales bacterium]|nr:Crp/Fnr family transcriptional regulator [Clostridiales bacterium]
MEKYINILKKCPLFLEISDENLLVMLKCLGAKVVSFDKKYTVFTNGKPLKHIGIVLTGSVQVIQVDYYGNRNIVSNNGVGEIIGEAFACAQVESLPVSVIANEKTDIMLIKSDHILKTCKNNCGFHQKLIYNLMKDIALKAVLFHQKIEIISRRTTREKLMAYLNLQAKKAGKSEFTIPFDRQELADYLIVDRSGLSNEISKLREEGIIESHKNYFELTKPL